jgi:hypothetical protein
MRAYQRRKSATIVAKPRKTRTATFAEELLAPFAGETEGVGAALGDVTVAGALKRNV